jgi:hypothetical protein
VLIATLVVIVDVYIIPSKSSLTQTYHIGDTINDDWKFVGFGKPISGILVDFSNSNASEDILLGPLPSPIARTITIGGVSYYVVAYNANAGWIKLRRT